MATGSASASLPATSLHEPASDTAMDLARRGHRGAEEPAVQPSRNWRRRGRHVTPEAPLPMTVSDRGDSTVVSSNSGEMSAAALAVATATHPI
jgi:hypothetical protein